MEKKTVIVMALFCCGKSTLAKRDSEYSILDLDDHLNPRVKPRSDKEAKFPKAAPLNRLFYKSLEDNLGKYDVILLPYKEPLVDYLRENKMKFALVYPENTEECRQEWKRRNVERGTEWLWRLYHNKWETMLVKMSESKAPSLHVRLKPNEYISDKLDEIIEILRKEDKE